MPAIGIDLGTTFSCAAIYRDSRAEIIPNKDGKRLTPSCIFYNPCTFDVSVGSTAENNSLMCLQNGLFDMKRIVGRKFDDIYVRKIVESEQVPFHIIRGLDDVAKIQLKHKEAIVLKTPEEVSAELLKYLKDSASIFLGSPVTEVVISVPAFFSNAQRLATKRAAEAADLKVLKLVTEPVAGAIHYCSDKLKTNTTMLVFDLGGGTLDVSIVGVNSQKFEVIAVNGDTFLGGRDFDEILFSYFQKELTEKYGESLNFNKKVCRRLKGLCTTLKEKLSNEKESSIWFECIAANIDEDYCLQISRNKFNELCEHLFNRSLDIVNQCLHDSGLSKSDISEILLVGGATRIPKIQEMLSSYFGFKKLKMDLNPDEVIALGASMQAALLTGEGEGLEKYKITEVTPLSLGIRTKENFMSVVIEKNTNLPVKKSYNLQTRMNDQKVVSFEIYEGVRKNCAYNNSLGEFDIKNLPPGRAGDVKFEVSFYLDENGILEVSAKETSTGHHNKLVVTMGEFRLCKNKIDMVLEGAKENKREDDIFEEFTLYRNKSDKLFNHVLYDLENIPSVDREYVKMKCENFLKFSESLDFHKIKELREEFEAVRDVVYKILPSTVKLNLENS